MAPYFPSQNGAAKRLNHTLVELTRAMLIACDLSTFLWEYAIDYAAYTQEHVLTCTLPNKIPYEAWHRLKQDVSNL